MNAQHRKKQNDIDEHLIQAEEMEQYEIDKQLEANIFIHLPYCHMPYKRKQLLP